MIATNEILSGCISALQPSSAMKVSDWVEANRKMTQFDSPVPGMPYSCNRAPYTRFMMDTYGNQKIRMMVFKGGTQLGKSNMLYSCLAWQLAERPTSIMLALPSVESAQKAATTRVDPMVDASPALAALKLKKNKSPKLTKKKL